MKIITALENPKINEKLKKETDFEIIGNDIQYQEGVIEILEKNKEINLLIISELLPGETDFIKLIEKIKTINKKIEIIAILKDENEETKNYLISKGIFNIIYNNKITIKELINLINKINYKNKEIEINEEIKKLKEIILEKENNNKKHINYKFNLIKTIKNKLNKKTNNENNSLNINNKILNIFNIKKHKKTINYKNKIISVVGTNGVGKSIFSSILSKLIKNKKILLIDFDIFNQSINSIFNVKRNEKNIQKNILKNNINKLIIKANKNIDLLCATDILFDGENKIEKNKIKEMLEKFSNKYDLIIIDTTSECFFDYTKEILQKSDIIIFLLESNLIELKKSKNLLDIYINKWKINKEKFNIIFNKENINSIDPKILKTLFSDFNILEKIKLNNKFNLIINNNLKIIDKKIKKKFEIIIKKLNIEEE